MGQVMLEGCENGCQSSKIEPEQLEKSGLYFNNLLTELPPFTIKEGQQRYYRESLSRNEFLHQAKTIPIAYIQEANLLSENKIKFEDHLFRPNINFLYRKPIIPDVEWVRLPEYKKKVSPDPQKNEFPNRRKLLDLLLLINANYPSALKKMKPKYLPKIGLAVCELHLNGVKEEIIIDDFIPNFQLQSKYASQMPIEFFLIQKAFAKALGCYGHIEDFSSTELYSQITGLPYFSDKIEKDASKSRQKTEPEIRGPRNQPASFREATGNSEMLFRDSKVQRTSQPTIIFCFREGYEIASVDLKTTERVSNMHRFTLTEPQQISLRLSLLNKNYEAVKIETYPQILFELYMEGKEGRMVGKESKNMSMENCLYIGNNVWTSLEAGTYVAYSKNLSQYRKVALVSYASKAIVFKQVHTKALVAEAMNEYNYQQAKNSPDSTLERYVGQNQESILTYGQRMFVNMRGSQGRWQLELLSTDYMFENEELSRRKAISSDTTRQSLAVLVNLHRLSKSANENVIRISYK